MARVELSKNLTLSGKRLDLSMSARFAPEWSYF